MSVTENTEILTTEAGPQPTEHLPLPGWNDTGREYPRKCIHEVFEEQAAQSPEAIALQLDDRILTYRELNETANRLASFLRKSGVGPRVMVGVCLERSLDMVVTLLSVLKAGGAYVPLDAAYPQSRLAFMLEDTKMPFIVTQQSLLNKLTKGNSHAVCIEDALLNSRDESAENVLSRIGASDLAYVMYTSGSTGLPKGVIVPHRAVVRLVKNTNFVVIRPGDVYLQLAPISFDASTLEIWAPLLNGARLALMSPQPPSLGEIGLAIQRYGVTTMWLTASLFNLMVEQRSGDLGPLRQLLVGGEVLSPPHVFKAMHAHPHCQLINGYGPTENTTFTCCHLISRSDESSTAIPIGRPISNTHVYILDANLKPVPIGESGELYAGGDGVALGYLNRPELTAEKFIQDPFSEDPMARLYRTGDLVRYRPDGVIEFLGREDQQVKIAGNRIELGEIEAALRAHPAVDTAVVVLKDDAPGQRKLVGYLVPKNGDAPGTGELRSFLQDRLPAFMVPAVFVTLESLPLSPNGKIDRGRLPIPEFSKPGGTFTSAQNQFETKIAEIWKKVLRVEKIGMDVNFFDLGGDSLQLIEIHAELQKNLTAELSITDLFEFPSIASLAKRLEAGLAKQSLIEAQDRAEKQKAFLARQKQLKVEQGR